MLDDFFGQNQLTKTHKHTHTHTHTRTRIRTYTHTHTHTYTPDTHQTHTRHMNDKKSKSCTETEGKWTDALQKVCESLKNANKEKSNSDDARD